MMLALALALSIAAPEGPSVLLEAGDYRWVPLNIRQPPVQVDVSFAVSNGQPTVHAEIIPERAFRLMQRGQAHEAVAFTAPGISGDLRSVISDPGVYRVVIANTNGANPALVSWRVSTVLDPAPSATELSPRRRMVTIAVSFLLFFTMVGYAGVKLRRSAQTH